MIDSRITHIYSVIVWNGSMLVVGMLGTKDGMIDGLLLGVEVGPALGKSDGTVDGLWLGKELEPELGVSDGKELGKIEGTFNVFI